MSGVVNIKSGSEEDLLAAVATVGPTAVVVDGRSNGFRVQCEEFRTDAAVSIGFRNKLKLTRLLRVTVPFKHTILGMRLRTRVIDGLYTV